jgi:hypothetical protein
MLAFLARYPVSTAVMRMQSVLNRASAAERVRLLKPAFSMSVWAWYSLLAACERRKTEDDKEPSSQGGLDAAGDQPRTTTCSSSAAPKSDSWLAAEW